MKDKFKRIISKKLMSKKRFSLKDNNEGISTVEIIMILLVLVGLIVIFRANILNIINSIFARITESVDAL